MDFKILSRVALALIGIFIVLYHSYTFVVGAHILFKAENLDWLPGMIFNLAGVLLVLYFFVLNPDLIVNRIVSLPSSHGRAGNVDAVALAFRLAFVLLGLYLLANQLLNIITFISAIFAYTQQQSSSGLIVKYFLAQALRLALVLYLIAGAPHLVRFHLRAIRSPDPSAKEVIGNKLSNSKNA